MADRPPRAIDCFSGAGGLSLGLQAAGFFVCAAFDNDRKAVDTYQRNIGKHALCADVRDIKGAHLLEVAELGHGECELLTGGPPCQGFSRQRRGLDADHRNDLIFEFLRLVADIHPTMFMMENVPSIAGQRGQAHLRKFREGAAHLGYRVHQQVLNAADFGVPQYRLRYFVVGEPDDGLTCFLFPRPTCEAGCYRTVRDAIGDLPSPLVNPRSAEGIPNHQADGISDLNRLRISHVPQGGGRQDIPADLRLPCHEVSVEKAGHRGVYGRLSWDQPAGTITTKCNSFTRGRFAHPEEHRNISMREAARLQGFPDSFAFEGSKVDVAHQIGNAVPPPLATHLGLSVSAALRRRRMGMSVATHQLNLRV